MNELRDFLSWFDGYAENIKAAPNKEQWKRIKERMEAVRKAQASAPAATSPATLKVVPGDPTTAIDPRFTPETMPKKVLSTGAAMDAGPGKK